MRYLLDSRRTHSIVHTTSGATHFIYAFLTPRPSEPEHVLHA